MDNSFGLFTGEYGERLERHLTELTQRFSERVNEDPALRSVIICFIMSFVLLALLILFVSLFIAIGCVCVLTYFCMTILSALASGIQRY